MTELSLMAKIIWVNFGNVGQKEKRDFFNQLQKMGLIFLSTNGKQDCMNCIDDDLISRFFKECYDSNRKIPDLNNFFKRASSDGIPITIGISQEFFIEVIS